MTFCNQGGLRDDLDHELADAELILDEGLAQVRELAGPEGTQRLLDQGVEHLFDEGVVRLRAGGQERGESADAAKPNRFPGASLVKPGRVDGPIFFPVPKA